MNKYIILLGILGIPWLTACKSVSLGGASLETISINRPALYPEGLDYNSKTDKFLLGSVREGAVYEIGPDGSHRILVLDKRLNTVAGIRVDLKHNKLFVTNSELAIGKRIRKQKRLKIAHLGIYDLSSGKPLHFVNLGKLYPEGKHLANAVTVDPAGNAYVTDSFSPVIYKVSPDGKARIFLQSKRFLGAGINLNGIVYHPNGYLIVAHKSSGMLFKIPLKNPEKFQEIKLPRKLKAADGLILVNKKNLVVISNRIPGAITNIVFNLKSPDDWSSARIRDSFKFEDVYPTTGTLRKGKIYVVHSKLNVYIAAPANKKAGLREKAVIQQVGRVNK